MCECVSVYVSVCMLYVVCVCGVYVGCMHVCMYM